MINELKCEASEYLYNGSKGISSVLLNSDFLSRGVVFIDEPITAYSANMLMKEMMFLSRSTEKARLFINCPGGEVNAGLLMYDIISGYEKPLDICCAGQAASMAAVLLAAGKPSHRFILPHSRVMIHEVLVEGGIGGNDVSTAESVSLRCERPLSEILYMPVGDCVVFRRGSKPVHTKLLNGGEYIRRMETAPHR